MKNKIILILGIIIIALLGFIFFRKNSLTETKKEDLNKSSLNDCLDQINKKDPMGVIGSSTPKEDQERKNCFSKFSPESNPLGI